jgi:diadenosine tetraphosphate (Ap4A) HIT family hydrolase
MIQCPFCAPDQARIISSCQCAIAIRDGFPISEGHSLIIPKSQVQSILDLEPENQRMVWAFVAQVRQQLAIELNVGAFNIGINDGKEAGQTIEHAHIHVIPRRPGDVSDPRGGLRLIIPDRARYWEAK